MPDLVKMPRRLSMCHTLGLTHHEMELQSAHGIGGASGVPRRSRPTGCL